MTKAVISFGYRNYVMDVSKAVQFAELLNGLERYENKYNKEGNNYTYHVYESEEETITEIKLISDHQYRVAKAAGKPEK
jgi:hypothetical protein